VLAVTFVAFGALAVATILPVVGRHLGDLRLYGWVFSAFLGVVGHASTRTTEVVYRRELRPVITTGAEIMDELFRGSKTGAPVNLALASYPTSPGRPPGLDGRPHHGPIAVRCAFSSSAWPFR
jgi:hypothetical protein